MFKKINELEDDDTHCSTPVLHNHSWKWYILNSIPVYSSKDTPFKDQHEARARLRFYGETKKDKNKNTWAADSTSNTVRYMKKSFGTREARI